MKEVASRNGLKMKQKNAPCIRKIIKIPLTLMLGNNFACKTKRKWQKKAETESSSHKYVNSNKITRQTYIKQNKLKTAKTNERRDKTTPTKKSKSIINDVTALFSSFFSCAKPNQTWMSSPSTFNLQNTHTLLHLHI